MQHGMSVTQDPLASASQLLQLLVWVFVVLMPNWICLFVFIFGVYLHMVCVCFMHLSVQVCVPEKDARFLPLWLCASVPCQFSVNRRLPVSAGLAVCPWVSRLCLSLVPSAGLLSPCTILGSPDGCSDSHAQYGLRHPMLQCSLKFLPE